MKGTRLSCDGVDEGSFAGNYSKFDISAGRTVSAHTVALFICLQTAASFLHAWPGATDDIMRSVKASIGQAIVQKTVSVTLCVRLYGTDAYLTVMPF